MDAISNHVKSRLVEGWGKHPTGMVSQKNQREETGDSNYTCFKRFIVKGRREMLQKLAQRGSFFFFFFFWEERNHSVLLWFQELSSREKEKKMLETEGRFARTIFLNRWERMSSSKPLEGLALARSRESASRRQEKQSEWSQLLGDEPMEILPIASILQWMSLRNKLWKGCREQTVYEIVA